MSSELKRFATRECKSSTIKLEVLGWKRTIRALGRLLSDSACV
jgi:hypothetical protein